MTTSAEVDFSLRVGEVGDVARPLNEEEVRALEPVCRLLLEGRAGVTRLVLVGVVVRALRAGRCPLRSRAVERSLGPLVDALVVLVALDAREASCRLRVHAVVRALEPGSLDALEDMLSRFPAVTPIIEAERMHRAGLLAEDWALSVTSGGEPGQIRARVHAPIRRGFAEA